MSKEWVTENLNKIFDQNHYLKWLCAMQGYAYVGRVYQEVYKFLKELLLQIAPYSDESHNSYNLLKSIAKISDTQPFEAYDIWKKMLEGSGRDYPDEAVRNIFSNLLNTGADGLRRARDVVSIYLANGNDRPAVWLKEIREETGNE